MMFRRQRYRFFILRIASFVSIAAAALAFTVIISQGSVVEFPDLLGLIQFQAAGPASNSLSPLANQFFSGDGSVLSDTKWAATNAGPFTSAFVAGNTANFAIVDGIGAGGTISVGGINATENFTITSAGGRIGGTAATVNPITVSAGKTFDAGTQLWSNVGTVGFSLTGPGVFATSGGPFGGGFVLNSGTLVARAANAMGSGGSLTINGGTIAASDPVNFSSKFPGGIVTNANFQIGALTANVPVSLGTADITFSNNITLGAATRTITIGGDGNYIFGGVIAGGAGSGITVNKLAGTSGAVSLAGVNTYTGNTTINGGALALIASGSIANSPVIEIGADGIFDVTGLSTELTLNSGQALKASGTTSTGSINTSSTKGLITAANSPLQFSAFNGTTAPLTIALSGILTLQSSNPVTVTVANGGVPLNAGDYKLISKSGTASVAGQPTSVTVNGNGLCSGCTPSLALTSGELFLHVEAPTVIMTTTAATSVTSNAATLNGTGNPNGTTASGYFRYSTVDPGICNDSFGTRVPSSSVFDVSLGSGSSPVAYSQNISSLLAGTTYYFCAIGRNASATAFGSVLSFTTFASLPSVTTGSATNRTGTSATLNATANPGGAATTGWFRYSATSPGTCNDSFGTRAPTSGGSSLGSGTSAVAYSQGITGLTPGTTYFYCAIAQNSVGTSLGSILQFATPLPPTATTAAATIITDTTATLNGSGNPNGATTTGWFRYATTSPGTCNDTFGTRAPTSGGSSLGAGTSSQAYSQPITGLTPATVYFFCAITSSAEGTSFGSLLSFTTHAAPTTTTSAATLVTSNSATLNGSANPNGDAASGHFRYSAANPGTCNDTFGTRVPASSFNDASLGSGINTVTYSFGITGLSPATTYFFCAIANNTLGTSVGSVLSFTTQATLPTATTNSATNVTGTAATLNGSANPGGAAATGWFRYASTSPGTCNDTFGTRAPASGGSSLGSGVSTVAYSQGVAGLAPGTTYFYCAIVQNSVGTGLGSVLQFTTPLPPTATTSAATNIGDTTATLNGSGNPNGASATGWFRYSTTNPGACNDTFGIRAPTSGGAALGSGSSAQVYSQPITGLSAGTTYFFCAIASSVEGTAFGSLLTFTTHAAPTVTTSSATLITSSSATLNGSANPNGDATSGHFRYSTVNPGTCSDTFGTRAPASSFNDASLGAGTNAVGYSFGITGMQPATVYFFCAIANNSLGTSFGSVLSFTTQATSPSVTTGSASNRTGTSATLNATANPSGDGTVGWFRFAPTSPGTCNDSFGTRAPALGGSSLGAGTSTVAYSQDITGLSPGTTYFYCAIAQNGFGVSLGSLLQFTTPLPPTVTTSAASGATNSAAQLNGSGNPNGSSTTGWFRYSSTDPGTCNDTFGTRAPANGGSALGAGTSAQGYSQPIGGLSALTTYYFCAIVSSAEGTAFGAVLSFATTNVPPVVNGTVTYGNAIGAPTPRFVSNVTITAAGSPTLMTTTAAPGATAGQYSLTGFGAGAYTITPTKTGGVNGITSFDAGKIAQHVAGTNVLTGNPLIVADVSNNGSVTSFDAAQIARYVASSPPFGVTGTWKFLPVNRSYSSITGDLAGQDFAALLMGEVSGNWTNTGARTAKGFHPEALSWLIGGWF